MGPGPPARTSRRTPPLCEQDMTMRFTSFLNGLAAASAGTLAAGAAAAQIAIEELEIKGAPVPGGTGFQFGATELARDIHWLDGLLNVIIFAISLFVLALIALVIVRFNRRANPTPARFTHNQPLEVAWTMIPIIILVFIGAFSLPVLFKQLEIPEGDVTVKVTGYQWYWGYEYVDEGIDFASFMLQRDELAEYGYPEDTFLLATDTAMVVPTGRNIVVQITGADVIHSWFVPAFGVKQDAVPGRLTEKWFRVDEGNEGIYFGQCTELCGKDHAYMPITVVAVTPEDYDRWLEGAREGVVALPRSFDVAAAE
jgi:cytochrome c oxidase subunit 2